MVNPSPQFPDIQNHWARPFIEGLAQRGIVSGFPDGTFQPNSLMNRAQFAAIVNQAFSQPIKRRYIPFTDVPATHWAAQAIKNAYETEFLSGYPDNRFRPNEMIIRVHVLLSLVNGLGIRSNEVSRLTATLPSLYVDSLRIPTYAREAIAIATGSNLVVNYPNLRSLNPTTGATRAEVAAFIYQALVYLGQAPRIESNYIVVPFSTVHVSHTREFRGVWLTTAWNIDWPSSSNLAVEQQKDELIRILNRMQEMNMNALIFQVRPEGDAFYASQLEPWSAWLTGTQGKAPQPFYDPLAFAIAECHKRNIELHAWFNPYRARISLNTSAPVRPHISVTNPEFVYRYGNQLWMDPGAKVVQDRAYNVILDVVRRYDIDGIHLDDYFYPYPIAGQAFPDSQTYATYRTNATRTGQVLSLADWRRENVNTLIRRLITGIRTAKPHVKFGISPFGIYRPGQPPQIQGLDAYNSLYADAKKWLEEAWIDYCSPQLYWRIDQTAQSYPVLLNWWTQQNPKRRHIYPGNNLSQLDGRTWTLQEITRQVDITRNLRSVLALGNIFFSMNAFVQNRQGIYNTFRTTTYAKPALVPSMPWFDTTPPNPPTGVRVQNRQIIWDAAPMNLRSWTLYQQSGNTWNLIRILSVTTTTITVEPGTYAVCAVNRMANESGGIVVTVR